jgi:hypothetical protein
MDFMRIYRDESLLCPENLVEVNMLVPGQYYFWQFNALLVLFKFGEIVTSKYITGIFIVYNGRLTYSSSKSLLYTNRCNFYNTEKPLFKEIKNIRVAAPITLRMLAFNQLDENTKLEYSYAASVYRQLPPIPPD